MRIGEGWQYNIFCWKETGTVKFDMFGLKCGFLATWLKLVSLETSGVCFRAWRSLLLIVCSERQIFAAAKKDLLTNVEEKTSMHLQL